MPSKSKAPEQPVTLRAYAQHRGCALSTVYNAVKLGRITLSSPGQVLPSVADAEWAANTQARLTGKRRGKPDTVAAGAAKADLTLNQAKTREALAKAELAEIEVRKRRGDLVPLDQVRAELLPPLRKLRDRLLSVPSRLAPVLLAADSAEELAARLKAELRDALAEASAAFGADVEGPR